MHRDHEMYFFLSMCNLCRYARFLQAQSHLQKLQDDLKYTIFEPLTVLLEHTVITVY